MNRTAIEWTDTTWNPIRGCSRVSEGCRNCYAERHANRFRGPGQPYEGLLQILSPKWNGQIKFVEEHLLDPLKWKGVFINCQMCGATVRDTCTHGSRLTPERWRSRRIFVDSMSDLFHKNVTDEMLDRIFAVMALCPQHTFQVLTKRPWRMLEYFKGHGASHRRNIAVYNAAVEICAGDFSRMSQQMGRHRSSGEGWWPLANVWLGVSVEDQRTADERIPLLLQTPAAVRFISAEPLLGSVDLHNLDAHALSRAMGHEPIEEELQEPWKYDCLTAGDIYWGGPGGISDGPEHTGIDWVIVGGESGPGARPLHRDWARSLRDQCVAAGVPYFFKQWGEWAPTSVADGGRLRLPDADWNSIPKRRRRRPDCAFGQHDDLSICVGKKAAGRLLDGREWNEFPEVHA